MDKFFSDKSHNLELTASKVIPELEHRGDTENKTYIILEVGPDDNPSHHESPYGPLYRMRDNANIIYIALQPKNFHSTVEEDRFKVWKKLSDQFGNRIKLVDGDILKRNECIPDSSVDEIVGLGTYISSLKYNALNEVKRILKPGGLLIVGKGNSDEPGTGLQELDQKLSARLKEYGFKEMPEEQTEYDYGRDRTTNSMHFQHDLLQTEKGIYRVKTYRLENKTQ